MGTLRLPAVAGRFYPADPLGLERVLDELVPAGPRRAAMAVVVPHAGYVYSGAIAGETFGGTAIADRAIVLCPNHTGRGARAALFAEGKWQIPGAVVQVDSELAQRLIEQTQLEPDVRAHTYEHAIEVQVPMLHRVNAGVRIVPICLGGLTLDECVRLGEGIARVLTAIPEAVSIVVSTDLSHYLTADEAARLDHRALEPLYALDAERLYRTVETEHISMCGYVPATVGAVACRARGARAAELVRYGNSGDVSGDFDRVVGYAGLRIA